MLRASFHRMSKPVALRVIQPNLHVFFPEIWENGVDESGGTFKLSTASVAVPADTTWVLPLAVSVLDLGTQSIIYIGSGLKYKPSTGKKHKSMPSKTDSQYGV